MDVDLLALRLMAYETAGGRSAIFWQRPQDASFVQDAAGGQDLEASFTVVGDQAGVHRRRARRPESLIKVADAGGRMLVHLHEDGTCRESDLFDRAVSWDGRWDLDGPGALSITIGAYELQGYANVGRAVQSGVEADPRTCSTRISGSRSSRRACARSPPWNRPTECLHASNATFRRRSATRFSYVRLASAPNQHAVYDDRGRTRALEPLAGWRY